MAAAQAAHYMSTLDAADALAVSVSTVKRWVDEGVLPAHRTAGGHRKLLRADVLALARQGGLPRGDLSALHLARDQAGHVDSAAAALSDALTSGQVAEVIALLRRAYSSGMALETIADRLIAPVMARVGQDWANHSIDVWQEHQRTQVCVAALYRLKDELEARAGRDRPLALGGAPEGDPTVLPSLLAQLVLLDAGWQAVNIGPDTPLASFAKALGELRPRLLWLSVTHLRDGSRFIRDYRALYAAAEQHGVAVALGGQGLVEAIRSVIPYTMHGDGLTQLAAFARTLHPRPKRPRRGRPPKR